MFRHLALQCADRILGAASRVKPALDGLGTKAHDLVRAGVGTRAGVLVSSLMVTGDRHDWRCWSVRTLRERGNQGSYHLLRDLSSGTRQLQNAIRRGPTASSLVRASARPAAAHWWARPPRRALPPLARAATEEAPTPRAVGARNARAAASTPPSSETPPSTTLATGAGCVLPLERHHGALNGTPVASRAWRNVLSAIARTDASSTTPSKYTRRPRNRSEGGSARLRQPSRPQHSECRNVNASPASAS